MKYKDGGIYEGGWMEDLREGMGRYEKEQDIYEGGWHKDKRLDF